MSRFLALLFGVAFLAAGALGYFHIGGSIVGEAGSGALLETNQMHDYLHLGSGALLLVGTLLIGSRPVLMLVGVVYALLAVAGFLMKDQGPMLFGMIYLNDNDRWLNVGLAAGLLVSGLLPGKG